MAKSGRKTKPETRRARAAIPKHMLLPLTSEHVKDLSLSAHLTLAACRSGDGSRQLLCELVRVTYMSYFLWESGYGSAEYRLYRDAEEILDGLSRESEANVRWSLDEQAIRVLEHIMQVYDEQIGSVSRSKFANCRMRLNRLLRVKIPHRVAEIEATVSA